MQHDLDTCSVIHLWIDLIFGFRSRGEAAIESQNLFHPRFYEKSKEETAPVQLFTKPHPARAGFDNPKVWDAPEIKFQGLVQIEPPLGLFDVVLSANNTFTVVSRASRYTKEVAIRHAKFDWLLGQDGSVFECTALSSDSLFFCGVVPIGIILVYSGGDYSTLVSQCFLPIDFLNAGTSEPCRSCCISSHIGVVCEAFRRVIYTFHVASGAFIRTIQVIGEINLVTISNSRQFIIAVGDNFIQLFTVNGTPVTKVDSADPITTAAVPNGGDFVLAAAVFTAAHMAVIKLWALDAASGGFVPVKTIEYRQSPICALAWFNGNATLFVLENNGGARLIVAPSKERKLCLYAKQIDACALCHKNHKSFVACHVCGMFVCSNCRTKAKICQHCAKPN
jgi:hypothetical protein